MLEIGKINAQKVIENGEESLHEKYDFHVDGSKHEILLAGVDSGSTQNRLVFISAGNEMEDLNKEYVIPSAYACVDDRELLPKGDTLYDEMDTIIQNINSTVNSAFSKCRVIRGQKLKDVILPEGRVASNVQKIKSEAFYLNIIDALGYGIAQKYNKDIPGKVSIYLGVALPPDELNSTKLVEECRNKLMGRYLWSFGTETISIEIKEVVFKTEPEAHICAEFSLGNQEVPEIDLHIDGGGRSIGIERLENGISNKYASRTLPYGGTQLANVLGDLYVNEYGGRAPKEELIRKSLRTGLLKSGASTIDITDTVKRAKIEFADRIFNDILIYLDNSNEVISNINTVSFSGRLFNKGDYEFSLADRVIEKITEISPNTEFVVYPKSKVALGLALEAYTGFGGFLEVASDSEEAEL